MKIVLLMLLENAEALNYDIQGDTSEQGSFENDTKIIEK